MLTSGQDNIIKTRILHRVQEAENLSAFFVCSNTDKSLAAGGVFNYWR